MFSFPISVLLPLLSSPNVSSWILIFLFKLNDILSFLFCCLCILVCDIDTPSYCLIDEKLKRT